MKINSKDLIGLPVETKKGEKLGKVSSLDLDCEAQSIILYHIKSANPIRDLIFQGELLISPAQIIAINSDKMIVEDNIIKEKLKKISASAAPAAAINLE